MTVLVPPYDVPPGRHPWVELTVADRTALRALRLPHGIRTATVLVRLTQADRALTLTVRPEWAPLLSLLARVDGAGCETELVFASPVPVHAVVAELGRQSVWPDRVGQRGLVVAGEERGKVPADVDPAFVAATVRAGVTDPDPVLALGPMDDRVLNPIGFTTDAQGPVLRLRAEHRGLPPESLVTSWRALLGMQVTPEADPRMVAGLAMAGLPLVAEVLAADLARSLGVLVAAAITAPVDLHDPLAREEHSVVLRRAALSTFATATWRRRLGEASGVRVHHQPSVSVVMATRRPELLTHAVAQVARQRGVEALELVLVPHGFDVPPGLERSLGEGLDLRVVPAPAEEVFGDVLNRGVGAAGGDVVLKMDDDDWYGPDFVADLLLARAYSGAELVGTPDDWHYLEPRHLTLRLGSPVEDYKQFVAGGTMLLDIGLLRELGGFRSVPRAVDAQLIGAVRAAGGAIYRTPGLGYLMRKTEAGHTWVEDLDAAVVRAATTYDGFRPSRLVGLSPT
ncbi:MAG: glycosyltransferase [Nocardioides sp.]|nr:glycosyltransferase [Nocardioides sp.]